MLKGKKILIGVSGSISAYKACELTRLFRREECEVRVVLTPSACQLVSPISFTALSGHPARSAMFDSQSETGMEHIDLARWADHYIIAPATANTIGELALGLTGSLVSSLFLAYGKKAIIAPAMNSIMLMSPQVQKNIHTLKKYGHYVLPTTSGELACGELGLGKLLEPALILEYVKAIDSFAEPLTLDGLNILLAAGHTEEKWDDVRFLSNRSSGKTALAIGRMAKLFGSKTTLLKGKMDGQNTLDFESGMDTVEPCVSTGDFNKGVEKHLPHCQVVVMAAALADFVPNTAIKGKKSASSKISAIQVKAGANVMETVHNKKSKGQIIIAFALQEEGSEKLALEKWAKHEADVLVINTPLSKIADEGFGKDNIRACLLLKKDWKGFGKKNNAPKMKFARMSKYQLAYELMSAVSKLRENV